MVILKDICLFENLDDCIIKKIEDISSLIKLNKDNILFYEGDKSTNLYILLEGIIKLYKVTSSNKEITLKYFKKNEFIAEIAAFEKINYPATAQAFTPCKLLKINFKKFKELVFCDTKLSYVIIKSLINKIRNLENVILLNMQLNSKQRVAKYLLENSENYHRNKNIQIAQYLNMSPETLSRVLKVFKDENILNFKGKIINKEKLKDYFN